MLLKTSTILKTYNLIIRQMRLSSVVWDANDESSGFTIFANFWNAKSQKLSNENAQNNWAAANERIKQSNSQTKHKKIEEITNNHALFAMMMLSASSESAYNQIWWFNAYDWIWLDFISLLRHDTVCNVLRPRPWTLLRHPSDQSVCVCAFFAPSKAQSHSHSHSDWLLFC